MRHLRRCKGGRAVLEGPHLVREAIAAGLELRSILATPDFLGSPEGRALEPSLPLRPLTVEPRVVDEVTDADSPRGILALADMPQCGLEAVPVAAEGLYVYAEGLQDPGNVGALARVAEASGAAALALGPGSAHPHHPRALRASAGSLLRLPVARDLTPETLEHHLEAVAPRWLALLPEGGEDPYQGEVAGCWIVALGAEGPGLSPELARRADRSWSFPLGGRVESLNATVAAALALFELRRRRSAP